MKSIDFKNHSLSWNGVYKQENSKIFIGNYIRLVEWNSYPTRSDLYAYMPTDILL